MSGRRTAGAVLATVAALFVTSSAYLDWFGNVTAMDTPLNRLYETSVSGDAAASYWRSVALPLAIVTIVAVIGLIARSRLVLLVAWVVGAGTWGLFVLMLENDETVDFAFADLQAGAWQAAAALGVMLIGILIMGRPAREEVIEAEDEAVEPLVVEEQPSSTIETPTEPQPSSHDTA
jgi:type IV secretory pathway TrbF-like protein